MSEIYNKYGQVEDIVVAKNMANAEKPFRKKVLGLFKSPEKIKEGEKIAAEIGSEYEKLQNEFKDIKIECNSPELGYYRNHFTISAVLKGHKLNAEYAGPNYSDSSKKEDVDYINRVILDDKILLSGDDLERFNKKYREFIKSEVVKFIDANREYESLSEKTKEEQKDLHNILEDVLK